jgi:hypothetical protein
MGSNDYCQSGNANKNKLNSIYKLKYFKNKNLKIKKIVCGATWRSFVIFLTG